MLAGIDQKTRLLLSTFGLMLLCACSTTPPEPPKLDASVRKPLNQHLQADPTTSKRLGRMRITVAQALESYVPASFVVYTDEGVDLTTPIRYDNTLPWTQSLGTALAMSGIEMVADLDKKTMILKALPTSLAQILDTHIPGDFTVYVDSGIDMKTTIKYDHKKPWAEEIGRALSSIGLEFIANLDKRTILVRRTVSDEAAVVGKAKGPVINQIKQLKK